MAQTAVLFQYVSMRATTRKIRSLSLGKITYRTIIILVLLFLVAFALYRKTQIIRQVVPSPDYSRTIHVLARQHQADLRS